MDTASLFGGVKAAPVDPTFGFNELFAADTNPNKINLCLGVYKDDKGNHYDFKIMKKIEELILADHSLNKAYLPFAGDSEFCRLS